ncbi:MAG: cell envelope integrity protein CreD [Pseudomonadota bacterium]
MFKSNALKSLVVGILILAMSIPLILVSEVIKERAEYSDSTKLEISQDWGGPQKLLGVALEIPVTAEVEVTRTEALLDPTTSEVLLDENGTTRTRQITSTETVPQPSLFISPNQYTQSVDIKSEQRQRGIFKVPVYRGSADLVFDFDLSDIEANLAANEILNYEEAKILLGLQTNQSLRGAITLSAGDQSIGFEPMSGNAGLVASLGDPRGIDRFSTRLDFNGAQNFSATASGRTTKTTLTSDWAHPSFFGDFLPDRHEITEDGFTAEWTIPHLARSIPLITREMPFAVLAGSAEFGLSFFEPNDFYQQSYRAARYGILFVGLTFLTILLLDIRSDKPVHAVQYLMVGLAQAVFVLLMVSVAEHIGFGPAYALAAIATIALVTAYAQFGMKFGRRSWAVAAVLSLIYGVLFFILSSEDIALLTGSILSFIAIAAMMYVTKDEDWSDLGKTINDATKVGEPQPTQS